MTRSHGYHLAQVNVARPVAPVGSPELADFVAALAPVNALADAAPGFVWRLQTDDGDATAVPVFGSTELMVNMSVWESVEALADFVFRSAHVGVMRDRRRWFTPMTDAYTTLWWIPAGTLPSVVDAEEHLLHLREHGATPYAFTMREAFPPPTSVEEVAGAGEVEGDARLAGSLDDGVVAH